MATSRKTADWPAIKAEYLGGTAALRQIAERHSISETAIRKRAKAEEWPSRPKKVRKPPVCEPRVRTSAPPAQPSADASDPVAIANQGRGLVGRMLDELDAVTTCQGELEDLILSETEDDENTKRRDGMLGAISLGGRAKTLKELATAFKTLNEAQAPVGKKQQAQDRAEEIASRFRPLGPPKLKAV